MKLRSAAALFVSLACVSCGSNHAEPFELYSVDGLKTYSLDDYKGKVLVLDFWATWCGPCHQVQPLIREWAETYEKSGVEVLGVTDEAPKVVSEFVDKTPLGYPAVLDRGSRVQRQFSVHAFPSLVILDRSGSVVFSGVLEDTNAIKATLDRLANSR